MSEPNRDMIDPGQGGSGVVRSETGDAVVLLHSANAAAQSFLDAVAPLNELYKEQALQFGAENLLLQGRILLLEIDNTFKQNRIETLETQKEALQYEVNQLRTELRNMGQKADRLIEKAEHNKRCDCMPTNPNQPYSRTQD